MITALIAAAIVSAGGGSLVQQLGAPSHIDVLLNCQVTGTGNLSGCEVVNPTLQTAVYESAALEMAKYMLVPTADATVAAPEIKRVTVPVRFPAPIR